MTDAGASPPERTPRETSPAERTARVLTECRRLGFDDAGVADARSPLFGAEALTAAREGGRLDVLPWLAATVDVRTHLEAFLPGARSVVIVVQNYFTGSHREHDAAALVEGASLVSRYAWGSDYHNVVKKRVRKLRRFVLAAFGDDVRCAPFTDTEPVLERAWAQAAGLGFVGKSGMFIHRRLGTWTFLGGIATTVELAPTGAAAPRRTAKASPTAYPRDDELRADLCGTCRRCLDACPTQAFRGPFELDPARCLTTWTIERPLEDPPGELAADLEGHGWAAGCDVCQEVCPWNRFATLTGDARFAPRPERVALREGSVPDDHELRGSPLARAGRAGLERSVRRARRRRLDDGEPR